MVPAVPLKAEVGLEGVVTVPPTPVTMLQAPVPTVGVFAASVAEVPQMLWSGPAFEVVGLARNIIMTSSVEATQGKFEMVHLNVYVLPATPVNPDVGLAGVVTVPPAPVTMLQAPEPRVGVLAAKVADVPQIF